MFLFHAAYALGFIAIALGVMLIIWSARNQGKGVRLAKIFGYIITIVVIISTLCTSYYAILYWTKGYYSKAPVMISMTSDNLLIKNDSRDKSIEIHH